MNQKNRSFLKMGVLVLVLALALTALVTMAAASVTAIPDQAPLYAPQAAIDNPATNCTVGVGSLACDLYAITGTLTLANSTAVPIWGYSEDATPGSAQLPGPTIIVTEGDVITITLHNGLTQDTALFFPGQEMVPDLTGVPAGGVKEYSFTAADPGTYLYEAGLLPDAARQVAMGMFGALVVRPTSASVSGTNEVADGTSYENTILADGPVHYYRLGEAAPADPAADQGTGASNGTYGSAVTLPAPGLLANSPNTAAGFDGTSAGGYVDTGVTSHSAAGFSVEAWVNANAIDTAGHRIVAKDEIGVTGAWILWLNQGALRFQVRNSTNSAWVIAEAPTTPSAGTPFHVVGVFDGTDAILYLDGVEVDRIALGTAATNTNALPITIGADSDPSNPREHIFDGIIDEVAIYDYALPGTQITAHFNAASAPLGMTLTDSTANFTIDLVGGTLSNSTDGSSCTIAASTATTLTCEAPLSGGVDNTWAVGDGYTAEGASSAYGDAASTFDDEALLVLSEIDPALNANPAGFDMRDFSPKYRLINGKVYPETAEIPTAAGNKVLLRYVNAGIQQHTMGLLGMTQSLIARDGDPLPYPQQLVADTIAPGRTTDAIVTVPAAAGTNGETRFALYDTSMLLHNSGVSFGGMMTFLTVADGPPPSTGPTTGPVSMIPNPTDGSVNVLLSASINGVSNITNAEYFVDATGAAGSGCPITVGANTGSVNVSATIPAAAGAIPPCADLAALAHGDHTFYVHGSDGTWGAFNFAVLHLDKLGPATTGVGLTPNPSNGSVEVAVSATGNDTATGNSNIAAAEFFTDTFGADGSGIAMTVNLAAPIASLGGAINAADTGPEGAHTVYIHSMDSFGQWGNFATAMLKVDQTGPETGHVVADPNPNNGSTPYNPTVFAIRVDTVITDTLSGAPGVNSTILRVEGFITDTVDVADYGTGFPLSPRDGLYNETVEDAYVYIPLSTINALGVGTHKIWIHGQDASGNWGPTAFVDFVIETGMPSVSNVAVTPNTTDGTVLVALTATANDNGPVLSDIDLAEWFTGPDPGTGNGTPMSVSANGAVWDMSATVDASGWAPGIYQLNVRARDAAGNWSPTSFATLTVTAGPPAVPELLYFSTIGNGLVPGTTSPYDDADVYLWQPMFFSRVLDARSGGANILPTNADIDGLAFDANAGPPLGLYYISFSRNAGTNVPGLGVVQNEDIVTYDPDNGEWQMYLAGADICDGTTANIDAFDVVNGISYFSTAGNNAITGVAGPYDNADIYKIDPLLGCIRVFDASTTGLVASTDVNIDGLTVVDDDTFYISFALNAGTFVPGLGLVADESVVLYDAGSLTLWSMHFDGTTQGLGASDAQDLDAIDVQ